MKRAFLILSIIFLSCENNNDLATPATLQGKWVEKSGKKDTLTFGLFGGKESMLLGRGREMSNGFLVPKPGSGPYEYELLTDTISLRWYLSSNSAFNNFYFSWAGNKLFIGNFYESNSKGQMQVFEKLQ